MKERLPSISSNEIQFNINIIKIFHSFLARKVKSTLLVPVVVGLPGTVEVQNNLVKNVLHHITNHNIITIAQSSSLLKSD